MIAKGARKMSEMAQPLEKLVKELPPAVQAEVRDFAEFIMRKRKKKTGSKLRQQWAGGLRKFRSKYSSLLLQQKALEWRIR
jgi:hypothetical protein